MNMKNLPAYAKLLAPAYQHGFLRVLFSSDMRYANIDIITPENRLLNQTPQLDQMERLFQAKAMLTPLQSALPDFKMRLNDPLFLEECLSFMELLSLYQVALQALPRKLEEEDALMRILEEIQNIPYTAQEIHRQLLNITPEDCQNLYIMPANYQAKEQIIIDGLLMQGATLLDEKEECSDIQFYHTVNIRQEAEACAQYILTHHINADECNILLCNPELHPFMKQVFQHYQIPFTASTQQLADMVMITVSQLLAYYLQPNQTQLIQLLNANTWKIPYLQDFMSYLALFPVMLNEPLRHVRNNDTSGALIGDMDKQRLDQLEERAENVRFALYEMLSPLLSAETINQALTVIYDILRMQFIAQDLQRIKGIFQKAAPYLYTHEDLRFFIEYLKTKQTSIRPDTYQGAFVSDLQQPMPKRPFLFVLGCTQSHYPAFPSRSGHFDEAYVQQIPFPTMDERYQHHLQQITNQLMDCEHLYLSYAQSDFTGKGQEAALEIELLAKKRSIAYPLQTIHHTFNIQPTITPITAQALFIKDQHIHGSISALERYINCPYSYFLKYGLKLKEPLDNTFAANRLGTLSHYVLETLVNKYGKQYAQVEEQALKDIIHHEIQKVASLYINQKQLLNIMEIRIFHNLTSILSLLCDMEKHTSFIPRETEYAFQYDIAIDEDTSWKLKGIIDRLDICDDFIRIIDYKSSHKNLSEIKVFAAQQLQLLTYALISEEVFEKTVVGSYYYSLKKENISIDAGKMKRRPVEYIPYDHQNYEEQAKKEQRLDGWSFEDIGTLLDDDANHIKGFSMNKAGDINLRKIYDIDTLKQLIMQMYRIIGGRIKQGEIPLTPAQDACLYCTYQPICRYRGLTHEKSAIVESDESLYKKGGKSDD